MLLSLSRSRALWWLSPLRFSSDLEGASPYTLLQMYLLNEPHNLLFDLVAIFCVVPLHLVILELSARIRPHGVRFGVG